MFCPKCQRPIQDDVKFCPYCGASAQTAPVPPAEPAAPIPVSPFAPPTAVSSPVVSVPAVQPIVLPQESAPVSPQSVMPQPEHPVVGPIKRLASSTLFLVATILFTVATVLSLVSGFIGEDALTEMTDEFSWYITGEEDLSGLWGEDGTGGFSDEDVGGFYHDDEYYFPVEGSPITEAVVTSMVFSVAFSALPVIALWMIYAAGRDRRYPGMKTHGLTILQVMNIITLVVVGGLILLMLLVFFILFAFLGSLTAELPATEAQIVSVVISVCMAVFALVFAFYLFYGIKIILLIVKAKKTIISGVPVGKGSLFVAVMCYLSGAFCALGTVYMVMLGAVLSFLAGLVEAAALICFGVVAMRYRTLLQEMQFVMNQPPVPYVAPQGYYGNPVPLYGSVPVAPVQPAASVPPAPAAEPVQIAPGEYQE